MVKCDICKSFEGDFIEMARFNKKKDNLNIYYICECCSKFITNKYLEKKKDIIFDDVFTMIEKLGYKVQNQEAHCSFKIVLNNCAETTLYFRKQVANSKDSEVQNGK